MSFTRVQGSGKYQVTGVTTSPQTFTAGLADFTPGNLLLAPFVHYSSVPAQAISGISFNSNAGNNRITLANPTNDVNQVVIYDLLALPASAAHSTAVALTGTGAPDGHYLTGCAVEYSYTDPLTLVGTNSASGLSTTPSVNTPSTVQIGDLIVAAFVLADGTSVTINATPSGGTSEFTEGAAAGFEAGAAYTKIASVAGTQAMAWGFTGGNQNWSAVVSVYRSVPAGIDTLFFAQNW